MKSGLSCVFIMLLLLIGSATLAADTAVTVGRVISPMDGCGWIGDDGIRAAWLSYKQIDDAVIKQLHRARVNTVFLKHGFHDLLELASIQRVDSTISAVAREGTQQRMLENTQRAAAAGIHVFWVANYELKEMLPHLKRLGYQRAYAEGPSRYLRPGPNEDAAPLDPVFWHGITGAHGDLVARLSREHPIDGLLYDTEHYAGGMMYLQNSGFSTPTFEAWRNSRGVDVPAVVQAGKRYDFLKSTGRLDDYMHFLEEQAFDQGRTLAQRWHAINPHLILGIWPLLDNWYSQGLLRGFGGAVPALGLSGVEYYHGADQSRSMAEYFESRNPNLVYMPGFYPPHAYTAQQLSYHVETALRGNGHYWMLGPHAELAQPQYQAALGKAYEIAKTAVKKGQRLKLEFSVEAGNTGSPSLVVESNDRRLESPTLSLWSKLGGAALCEDHIMTFDGSHWKASVPLVRRITNNRYLDNGYRSGATYKLSPVPRERNYDDPYHTKLIDGRAYGYFGTTVAWPKTQGQVSVEFDLHRPYRIVRVEVAQPTKLEDRVGGPAELTAAFAKEVLPDEELIRRTPTVRWSAALPLRATFPVQVGDASEPDNPPDPLSDPRHNRAWLSWKIDVPRIEACRIRLSATRVRPNSSISLGEVVFHALVDGDIHAQIKSGTSIMPLENDQYAIAIP